MAMWYVTNQKSGVSALALQRVLGLGSYETAWTWLHKLRRAMVRPDRDALSGTVEVDKTYVGGVEKGKHGRETETKAIIAINRLRVSGTAKMPQVDKRVRHQLHAVVPLLDELESQQQSLEFILPGKGPLHAKS